MAMIIGDELSEYRSKGRRNTTRFILIVHLWGC